MSEVGRYAVPDRITGGLRTAQSGRVQCLETVSEESVAEESPVASRSIKLEEIATTVLVARDTPVCGVGVRVDSHVEKVVTQDVGLHDELCLQRSVSYVHRKSSAVK